jgi:hypothetical protein
LPTKAYLFRDIIGNLAKVIVTDTVRLFVICSGTHATDLYNVIDALAMKYQDIPLPLFTTENSLEVIYELSGLSMAEFPPSLNFRLTLDLLGVVGRYLELFILSISLIGQSHCFSLATNTTKFTLGGLKHYLISLQHQPLFIQRALDDLILLLRGHYRTKITTQENCSIVSRIFPLRIQNRALYKNTNARIRFKW